MRRRTPSFVSLVALATASLAIGACSALSDLGVVRPPRISHAEGRPAELEIRGPSTDRRSGGAEIRLWAEVENPNPFGVLLDRLDGTFFLEDTRAAAVDFPLGLELGARDQAVVPLDVAIDFDDLPRIADLLRRAFGNRAIGYRIEGTIGVDAGPLGDLTFGPMDVLEGELDASSVR